VILEDHWTRRDPQVYDRERGVIGDLGRLEEPAKSVVVGSGGHAAEARGLLEGIRAENPDDPFWRGVESLEETAGGVRVVFHEGVDPALRRAGGVDVACVLYGETEERGPG
jgi:hypothetical protein